MIVVRVFVSMYWSDYLFFVFYFCDFMYLNFLSLCNIGDYEIRCVVYFISVYFLVRGNRFFVVFLKMYLGEMRKILVFIFFKIE